MSELHPRHVPRAHCNLPEDIKSTIVEALEHCALCIVILKDHPVSVLCHRPCSGKEPLLCRQLALVQCRGLRSRTGTSRTQAAVSRRFAKNGPSAPAPDWRSFQTSPYAAKQTARCQSVSVSPLFQIAPWSSRHGWKKKSPRGMDCSHAWPQTWPALWVSAMDARTHAWWHLSFPSACLLRAEC